MAECPLETIINADTCDIQLCPECEMLHINLGSITLRMSEAQFAAFAMDISKALFTLRQREQSRQFKALSIPGSLH